MSGQTSLETSGGRWPNSSIQILDGGSRLLLDNASEGIAIVQDGSLKLVNRSLLRLTDYSQHELTSRPFLDFVHPDERQTVAERHLRRLKGEEVPSGCPLRIVDKHGNTRWTQVNTLLIDWDGRPAVLAFLTDITERKKIEENLGESERGYRLLADNISDVIWVTDMNLRPTYVSPSVTRLLGYSVEEALGLTLAYLLTPASLEAAKAAFFRALEGQGHDPSFEPPPLQVEVVRKDGSKVWVESTLSFVRDPNGQPVEALGVLRDVTERRLAEQAIRESERRYRLLAENVSDVIWVTDMSLKPIYFSPSVTRLLGYSVEEAMAGTVETRLTGASLEAVTNTFARALALEERKPGRLRGAGTLEVEFKRKDGSTVWADTTVSFVRNSEGRPVEILGVLRDITEQKKVEERLHHSLEALEGTIADTVQAIASTVETKDRYTAGHQQRVTQLACAIALEMGFSSERMRTVGIAGLLHDLGKISLPTEILSKPGKLTEPEFGMIKTHCQAGYDILKNIESFEQIAEIVLQHHERMNGSGYPLGLRGEAILLEARILAVSDVVEAMSSHRPYRPALGLDKALEEIAKNSGTLYDPDVVAACTRVFKEKGFRFDE